MESSFWIIGDDRPIKSLGKCLLGVAWAMFPTPIRDSGEESQRKQEPSCGMTIYGDVVFYHVLAKRETSCGIWRWMVMSVEQCERT